MTKGKGKTKESSSSKRIFQRKGERVLPCGHPRAILIEREIELLKWPNLEDRKLLINLTSGTGQPFFIRPLRIAGCQAASNALFISRKAQHVVIFCFLFFFNKRY